LAEKLLLSRKIRLQAKFYKTTANKQPWIPPLIVEKLFPKFGFLLLDNETSAYNLLVWPREILYARCSLSAVINKKLAKNSSCVYQE